MKVRALACGFLMVLLAGACSSEQGARPSVEKDDLIKRADAVCKAAVADIEAATKAQPDAASSADKALALLNEQLLPLLDKELGDLKDIGEPKTSRQDWDTLVKALDTAVSSIKQQAQDDPVKALTTANSAFADANAKAVAFGLQECGKT